MALTIASTLQIAHVSAGPTRSWHHTLAVLSEVKAHYTHKAPLLRTLFSKQTKAGREPLFFLDLTLGEFGILCLFLSDIWPVFWNLSLSSLISPKHRQWFYNKQVLHGLQGIIILGLETWTDWWWECILPGVWAVLVEGASQLEQSIVCASLFDEFDKIQSRSWIMPWTPAPY